MPKITLLRNGKTYEVPVGTSFLDFCIDQSCPRTIIEFREVFVDVKAVVPSLERASDNQGGTQSTSKRAGTNTQICGIRLGP